MEMAAIAAILLLFAILFFFIGGSPSTGLTPKPVASPIIPSPVASSYAPSGAPQTPNQYQYVFDSLNSVKAGQVCVGLAKELAGSSAWAVSGCSCSESASSGRKDYSCIMQTIAGNKPATASCSKASGSCLKSAEGYRREITFQEIAQKYG